MQGIIEDVLLLQDEWSSLKTPEMDQRGQLVRHQGADWLRERLPELRAVVGPPIDDLAVEGRDGTGPKSELPWLRVYSASRSPSATIGWYAVFLFDALGGAAYLTLGTGSTSWDGTGYVPAPAELHGKTKWAHDVLTNRLAERPDLVDTIELHARKTALGLAYETGTVVGFEYPINAVPSEDTIEADVVYMVSLLGDLYRAAQDGPVPGEVAPEVVFALETADAATGNTPPRATGQGFRLRHEDRVAIELRAVDVATDHYTAAGWKVEDVGKKPVSYDLHATRGDETRHIEVKGTVTDGVQVVLTRKEVDRQRELYPNNALVVVRRIDLDRNLEPPLATGGELIETHPWEILDDDLVTVSYVYATHFP